MDKTYTYKRKDGDTTDCYGEILEDSNFDIRCDYEDSHLDGVAGDIDTSKYDTWEKICKYLEDNYSTKVSEIESC